MKTACAWLLFLFAVLVPASATVMASAFNVSSTKLNQTHPVKLLTGLPTAKTSIHRTRASKMTAYAKAGAGDKHSAACDDCRSCFPINAMGLAPSGSVVPQRAAASLWVEPGCPKVEFFSDGQERPPRRA